MIPSLLEELPPPPSGKTGWPWTQSFPLMPSHQPGGSPWPKVSIVTPSFNQAGFIEETIRSVLLQGYPNLEYLIIDGGSTDGSVDIIRKYEPWLAYWVSEQDRGQSHALNKGFRKTTGMVMAYLNSDDIYFPHTLELAVSYLLKSGSDLLIGCVEVIEDNGETTRPVMRVSPHVGPSIHTFPIFANGRIERFFFTQPSMFWTNTIWARTGEIDEQYHYVMDRQWCMRALAKDARVKTCEDTFARFTLHSGSKSQDYSHKFIDETARMYIQFSRTPGFHRVPCLMESLRARMRFWQTHSYIRSKQLAEQGKRWPAFLVRQMAGFFRRSRLAIEALGEFQRKSALRRLKVERN